MRRIILGLIVAIIGALCATLFLISHDRVSKTQAASERTPASAVDSARVPRTDASPAAQIVNGRVVKAAALNSVNLPDPDRYPETISANIKRGDHANDARVAQGAEDRFTAKAQLSDIQKGQFVQLLEDLHEKSLFKNDGPPKPVTAEQMDAVEKEGYKRAKEILTAEQYKVFCDEIGQALMYVSNGTHMTRHPTR
ncbi:MAG TPA: hypothetical protein VKE42_03790 [Candidatus Cybelea sp.]|nr:hypothetical protein [Candidatus Cybelea sp.]